MSARYHFVKYNKGKAPYAEERYSQKKLRRARPASDGRLSPTNTDRRHRDLAVLRFEWQTIDMKGAGMKPRAPAVQMGYKIPEGHGPSIPCR